MVGKVCTVCRNGSYLNKTLSFFTYPGDPERRYEWLKAVQRLDLHNKLLNDKTRANHRICEIHFDTKYIRQSTLNNGRKYLSKNALPTLYLDSTDIDLVPMSSDLYIRSSYRKKRCLDDTKKSSGEPCTDMSEFCESVIKVSNGTQTFHQTQCKCQNKVLHEVEKRKKLCEMSVTSNVDEQNDLNTDMSDICEGVLKVSAATQTHGESERDRKQKARDLTTKVLVAEEPFLKQCPDLIPESLSQILKWSTDSSNAGKNDNFNLLALNLYHSGNSFDFLKNVLNLPTLHTLKQFLIPKTTKLDHNINAFKTKVKNMSAKERICCIAVKHLNLKANLYYDIKHDRIIGLYDVNGTQRAKLAQYAIIVIAQGIIENWVQPIAFSFTDEYDDNKLVTWIDNVIINLMEIGLDIKAFVSDVKYDILDSKTVTPNTPFFLLNGKKIFNVYDAFQLKCVVESHLKSHDFYFNDDSLEESSFCNYLSDLCDILNAKSRYSNKLFMRSFSNKKYQIEFLKYMKHLFENIKVLRKCDGQDVTENMKFTKHFVLTINSFMQLFDDLESLRVKFLLTHRLSHEYFLKKFINRITKVDSNKEFTGKQFNKCFVRSFVFNMLKKPIGSNIQTLKHSNEIQSYSQELLSETNSYKRPLNIPLRVLCTDYRQGLPEKNTFVYLCGYLYLKCLQRHYCDALRTYSNDLQESLYKNNASESNVKERSYLCSISLVKNRKIIPPDKFNDCIMIFETKFRKYFSQDVEIVSIGQEMLQEFANSEFDMPCPCFPVDFLKNLFVRCRLFYTVRKNNKMYRKQTNLKDFKIFRL